MLDNFVLSHTIELIELVSKWKLLCSQAHQLRISQPLRSFLSHLTCGSTRPRCPRGASLATALSPSRSPPRDRGACWHHHCVHHHHCVGGVWFVFSFRCIASLVHLLLSLLPWSLLPNGTRHPPV